jgi:hypothetical protein
VSGLLMRMVNCWALESAPPQVQTTLLSWPWTGQKGQLEDGALREGRGHKMSTQVLPGKSSAGTCTPLPRIPPELTTAVYEHAKPPAGQ